MKVQSVTQLKRIHKAIEEQQKVLSGPLSPAAMTKVKEAKERLNFIRDNQDDLLKATLEVRDATKDIHKDTCHSPAMILAQENFK